jgi:hypothetical protein
MALPITRPAPNLRADAQAVQMAVGDVSGSTNLQSSFGVTHEFRRKLGERLATITSLERPSPPTAKCSSARRRLR